MDKTEKLRDLLADAVDDPFEPGDVIQWVATGRYSFAALKTPVGWFTTSATSYTPKTLTSADLFDLLARPETSNVKVATSWVQVR